MTERTGHYLDTGDGLTPIDPPSGRATEDAEHTAWRAYLDHSRDCAECRVRLHNCPPGAALWDAYQAARS